MTSKKPKINRIRFTNIRSHVFLNFLLILAVILSLVLITSQNFYTGMVETNRISDFRRSISALEELNLEKSVAISEIMNIEKENKVIIEVYGSGRNGDPEYDRTIYASSIQELYYASGTGLASKTVPVPLVNYSADSFTPKIKYDDGCVVGKTLNETTGKSYFLMTKESSYGRYLFIVASDYEIIEARSQAISTSSKVITVVVFIVLSIAIYFYTTGVTSPLRTINTVTKMMATTNDKSLRIPRRNKHFRTETDETIENINKMYSSLITTQEMLRERSAVLSDELKQREADRLLRENMNAGISHELKTPIAIIMGYAEGAKFILDDKDTLIEYCDTIIEECNRMNELVAGILSLSSVKYNQNSMNYERFSIRDFINENIQKRQKLFEDNDITVQNFVTEDIYGMADLSNLNFVISNMLSNAISYIGGDRRIIRIRLEEMEFAYRIFVFNTGNHIPDDMLEAMWMNFYRGDSARLRSGNHFGLGLSIIKAVQDAHSQQTGVNNVDGGVEFWFDIQVAR